MSLCTVNSSLMTREFRVPAGLAGPTLVLLVTFALADGATVAGSFGNHMVIPSKCVDMH